MKESSGLVKGKNNGCYLSHFYGMNLGVVGLGAFAADAEERYKQIASEMVTDDVEDDGE